jgi:hypothetical protein
VHVDAEAAAVDLRRADRDEVADRRLDGGLIDEQAELDELPEQLGRLLDVVDGGE